MTTRATPIGFVLVLAAAAACQPPEAAPPHDGGGSGGSGSDAGSASGSGSGSGSGLGPTVCPTTFHFTPPPGTSPSTVQVTGDWNAWADPGVAMTADASGAFSATIALPAGLVAYKLLVDGTWQLDPDEHYQKYEGGIANSAVQVAPCALPSLAASATHVARPSAGHGEVTATVAFTAGLGASALDATSVTATLRHDATTTPIASTAIAVDATHQTIALDVPALADGKYTIFVTATDQSGQAPVEPLRLVFWVEPTTFTWQDALIYMVMTDRFVDGDPSNDPAPLANVDPREDYHGGDLAGVTQQITSGYFDKLGITVLWLSPFNTNPSDAWVAADGVHMVTGFHGYWPIKAREVDPRFGTADDLHALVAAAHAHGIRVIQDLVVQHVHQEHEYMASHPDWFNTTGCICGTDNCDWTAHRLDACSPTTCRTSTGPTTTAPRSRSPTRSGGSTRSTSTASAWTRSSRFPTSRCMNLVSAVRAEFEAAGTPVFMTGETAMGWNGDNLTDNLSQYQLISQYIDPDGLDGQFDFVLYYAVPMNVFATTARGMIHADYWTKESQLAIPGRLRS